MAIFGKLQLEKTVQVDDKTRLDATKSFDSDGNTFTLVEIEPISGNGFVDVTNNKYLDWSYSTDGTVTVSVRITTGSGGPDTFTKDIEVISEADDKLFSNDQDIMVYEPNILKWIKEGRNSFLDVHREAQIEIFKFLDNNGYHKIDGAPITKANISDIAEFADWSKFMVLKIIFEGLSNATDDIFHEKALRYKDREYTSRDRAIIRVDLDEDGNADVQENIDLRSITMNRE